MGILLSCQKISKTFGTRPLFEGLSFGLFDGERTGLIGPNGMGKSTLLKILAEVETPDDGELSLRRGLRVGYLPQRDRFENERAGTTVRESLARTLHDLGLEDYEVDARVDEGLSDAGFSAPDAPLATLSGGWRKRLAILAQVLRSPDLLLLDEPTNHLDLEGVLWLERFLSGLSFSFLVVTHDRRFLERVTNRVIELNRRYPDGYFSSVGAYSDFLESREKFFTAQAALQDSLENTVRREIEWLRRGPKARTTKQKARIDRAGALISELGDLRDRNGQTRAAGIDFTSSDRKTRALLQGAGLGKSFSGRRLFGGLNIDLQPGDKLGLLGGNGSGKSTLLKILAGTLEPDEGVLKRADRLRVVTFDQHRETLDPAVTLRKTLCPEGDHVHYRGAPIHVFGWAERFLFRKEQMEMPLGLLSGGEQSRVLIARLMLQPADLLLLDEPTNDLDIQSLEVLEESLRDFPGALVLVTHDRYLLDRVSDNILSLDGRGTPRYFADLAQWEDRTEEDLPPAPSTQEEEKALPPAAAPRPGLTGKELKELKNMEASIHAAEESLERARAALEDPSVAADAEELQKRQTLLDAAHRKVDALMARWEELESRK